MTPFATAQSRSYRKSLNRVIYGGPRRPQPGRFEQAAYEGFSSSQGSHMPIDTEPHWTWRNPLNIIPAFLLLMIVVSIVEIVFL